MSLKKLLLILSVTVALCLCTFNVSAESSANSVPVTENDELLFDDSSSDYYTDFDASFSDTSSLTSLVRGKSTTQTIWTKVKSASCKNIAFGYVFTKHAGGKWDTSAVKKGAYIKICYSKSSLVSNSDIYVDLYSTSATSLKNVAYAHRYVYPSSVYYAGGVCTAYFNYSSITSSYGTHFNSLDRLSVKTNTSATTTLRSVKFVNGTGAVADTQTESWVRNKNGNVAFLGDSISDFARLLNGDWNTLLGRNDCVNYGVSASTTANVFSRLSELKDKQYSKVFLICGINDLTKGSSVSSVIANDKKIVAQLKKYNPSIQVYLVSVLPFTKGRENIPASTVVSMNKALKSLASSSGKAVTYVNVYSSFVKSDGYAISSYLMDGLHPSAKGYKIMANILKKYVREKSSSSYTVSLSKKSYYYTAKAIKPAVTVKYNGKVLSSAKYTVKYYRNIKMGQATIKVKIKGNNNSICAFFNIVPTKTPITVAKRTVNSVTFSLNKYKQIDGIVIYRVSANGTKTEVSRIKGDAGTYTANGLKSNTVYYFTARSYKIIDGVRCYGAWSKATYTKTR